MKNSSRGSGRLPTTGAANRGNTAFQAAEAAAVIGGLLFGLREARSKSTNPSLRSRPTATASAAPVSPTPTTATSGGRVIPFPRIQAADAIEAILRPLATPDEILEVLAGAGERGYVQPFSQRLVGLAPAGRVTTGSIVAPAGLVIFAVGDVLIDVGPHTPNAYVFGFSEDHTPPSIAPLQFTRRVEFPAAFLLPAQIDVTFSITGDPDLDLIYPRPRQRHRRAVGLRRVHHRLPEDPGAGD